MFERYFGFTRTPFARDLKPSDLFDWSGAKEMRSRLNYAAERKLFGVFTGNVGAGKTTIVRWFVEELPRAKYKTLYIHDSELTPRNLYWECLNQLGIKPRFYRGDAKRQLNAVLVDMAEGQGKTPVVIIDEAHLLSHQMLEEIRFLTNFRMDSYSPMSLILVGQTELLAALQRVSIRWHLPYCDLSKTTQYIEHSLKIAGVNTPLFTDEAIKVIHEATQGAARAIGGLSCSCLLHAMSTNAKLVDDHSVKLVLENEYR
jgi:type II secretory pathway predicted ATPase ExeA